MNQRLWIGSAGVLESFQNIPSSSHLETDSQVDLAAAANPSHWGLRPFCLDAFNTLSSRPSLFSLPLFLTNSHLHPSLFPCYLPNTSSLHSLLFFLVILRRSFSTTSSISKCYGAVVNSGLDRFVICMFCVRAVVWNSGSSLWHQFQGCLEPRAGTIDFFFYWSLTILIFHRIAALLIFKQSVKWQWLEQGRVNRIFAYRKLLYYNVHSHKLSLGGSQNMVTSPWEEETEK